MSVHIGIYFTFEGEENVERHVLQAMTFYVLTFFSEKKELTGSFVPLSSKIVTAII